MRAEDVNPEWVEAGAKATYEASDRGEPWEEAPEWIKRVRERHVRHALAAVVPLIAAQERERCARVAEKEVWCPCGGPPCQTPPGHGCGVQPANGEEIAAAIRALGDADG